MWERFGSLPYNASEPHEACLAAEVHWLSSSEQQQTRDKSGKKKTMFSSNCTHLQNNSLGSANKLDNATFVQIILPAKPTTCTCIIKSLISNAIVRLQRTYIKCLLVELHCLFCKSLLPLDVGQVVEGVSMCRAKSQCCVVAFLCFLDLSLFLECISQVAVRIWEVWLKLNGTSVGVDGEIDESEKV